ncbi:MAG: hypothetical protein NTZ16_01880 [Verrucomicrobia bacterium]|nr:hypothetical protein [Verrucomicrobiota bacterium]
MDLHDILKITGSVMALALFVPLMLAVLADGGAGQSFATWALWAALDSILTVSLYQQHGNYWASIGFALGGMVMTALLLWRRRWDWGWLETVILVLVLVCLAVWRFSGAAGAILAATAGICIAGIPGLVALWRNPERRVGTVWAWYVVANAISFFGGRAMTAEERFAPGMFTLFSVLMVLASRRKKRTRTNGERSKGAVSSRL